MFSQKTSRITKLLVGASALAMIGGVSVANAQEDPENAEGTQSEDTEQDVIVVKGYRSSLESAQDLKEDASTFLDAITAEDIGALPDRSVAEALQRVPGVNISRFEQQADPDRFSVEGSGVIVRGLPFVRSELNGREVFSANGGRVLSFNDISPELLGGVLVYKNTTADMIDGGIAGTVNLITRKPLDEPGRRIAGTIEANYGDLAEESAPAFSFLASDTFENNMGTFGLQVGYAQSKLQSKADASQVTDPCYRASTLDGPCFRYAFVDSAGINNDQTNFTPDTFPPAGSVIVPKGAGVRTTDFERDRSALSVIGQFESADGKWLGTLEYLKAEADQDLSEYAILALVNDDNLFPIPQGPLEFDSQGVFRSGTLTQAGPGIPTENLRFQREDEAMTEDLSFDLKWDPNDTWSFNFEAQQIKSDRDENGFIAVMQTYSDIFIDLGGDTPDVQFLPANGGTQNTFTDPSQSFYWFMIDNQVKNEGELQSFRADVDYDFGGDDNFFRSARFGARWADRSRVTRNANFSNWGNLSAPWLGSAIYANDPNGNISDYSQVRDPFADFQRGEVGTPVPGGSAIFYGGDNLVQDYLDGTITQQATEIGIAWENTFGFWDRPNFGPFPNLWRPLEQRGGLLPNSIYRESEVSDVSETTTAFYGRVDFGSDSLFGNGWALDGNIGIRYVETSIDSDGVVSFPDPAGIPPLSGTLSLCNPAPGLQAPGYCALSPERFAEFTAAFTGEQFDGDSGIEFEHWLPSFNAKLEVRPGLLIRAAASKGISRPDLALYRVGGSITDNTNNLQQAGTLETGPLFRLQSGNPALRPVESTNLDLSVEWYWDDVGSLTGSVFHKDLSKLVTTGVSVFDIVSPNGAVANTVFEGAANNDEGTLKGFEVSYQQVYDFLPAPFDAFGAQATYTYIDAEIDNSGLGAAQSAFSSDLSFVGVSENTVNLTGFYETDKLSARLAWNWRDEYLITPRDVIFPFSPIIAEPTGQLDGSIFYNITDNVKVGMQGVNLLDEVVETSQVIDFDGNTIPRSAFRTDRRYTFLVRFDF